MNYYFRRMLLYSALLFLFTGCTGKELYDLAIGFSTKKSGLVSKDISIGHNLKISYYENYAKNKKTLVLLHGFGVDKSIWLPLAMVLGNKYHLIIPDFIGAGSSSKPTHINYSLSSRAARIHRFITHIGVKDPVIVGNSMGGAVAAYYAFLYNAKSLILIDPLGLERGKSYLEKMLPSKAKKFFVGICTAKDMQNLIDTSFGRRVSVPGVLLKYLARKRCRMSKLDEIQSNALYRNKHWLFAKEMERRATHIKVPTLILWGKDDKVLSYKNAYAFKTHIPHSKLIIIKRNGHIPMFQSPCVTAKYITEFLNKIK